MLRYDLFCEQTRSGKKLEQDPRKSNIYGAIADSETLKVDNSPVHGSFKPFMLFTSCHWFPSAAMSPGLPASLPCICTLGEDKGANGATVSYDISKIASLSFSHVDIKSLASIGQEIAYWNSH